MPFVRELIAQIGSIGCGTTREVPAIAGLQFDRVRSCEGDTRTARVTRDAASERTKSVKEHIVVECLRCALVCMSVFFRFLGRGMRN